MNEEMQCVEFDQPDRGETSFLYLYLRGGGGGRDLGLEKGTNCGPTAAEWWLSRRKMSKKKKKKKKGGGGRG